MYALYSSVQCTYKLIYKPMQYTMYIIQCTVYTVHHSWLVRTLRTKKPKAHFYFPEIKYKVTIHILV